MPSQRYTRVTRGPPTACQMWRIAVSISTPSPAFLTLTFLRVYSEKSLIVLLVLLLIGYGLGDYGVGPVECDPSSTCIGPVIQRWTTNTCSGNATYYSVLPSVGCNAMSQGTNGSTKAVCVSGSGSLEIHDFYGSSACTSGKLARKRWYLTGTCLPRQGGGSEAYWCGAGSVGSVKPRKATGSSFPSLPTSSSRCTSNPDLGCGRKVPTLFYYRFDNCAAVPMQGENPFYGNGVLDTCYSASSSAFLVQSTCNTDGITQSYYDTSCSPSSSSNATLLAYEKWFYPSSSSRAVCFPTVPMKSPSFSSTVGFVRPDCMQRIPSRATSNLRFSWNFFSFLKALAISAFFAAIH